MIARTVTLRARGVETGPGLKVFGRIQIFMADSSTIRLGTNVVLAASAAKNSLEARGPVILRTTHPNATIRIGNDTGMTSVTISSACGVTIGNRVLIGAGVILTDSDHHVVRPPPGVPRRQLGMPDPSDSDLIVVEDDVFIGARSIVLKGVTVGRGSVIGAGSVVTKSVPPGVIAAGNPCRIVGAV